MNKNTTAVIFSLVVIVVIGGIALAVKQTAANSKALEPFAQCINDSGAKFYGAYWCPHCNQQKSLFERAHKSLPYVECSTADGKGQTDICIEEEIESYPTWKFIDGTISGGLTSLAVLAEKTGCELPAGENAESTEENESDLEVETESEGETGTASNAKEKEEVKINQDGQTEPFTIELE